MLLSFLPPSHMVVPERILVNTIFPFEISIQSNLQEPSRNMATDMEVNTPRGQSTTSSTNSSRATSVHSDVFSTACAEHIQALSNNPTWADQIEISKSKEPALFYVTPNVKDESGGLNLFSFSFLFLELRVRVRVTIGYGHKS